MIVPHLTLMTEGGRGGREGGRKGGRREGQAEERGKEEVGKAGRRERGTWAMKSLQRSLFLFSSPSPS